MTLEQLNYGPVWNRLCSDYERKSKIIPPNGLLINLIIWNATAKKSSPALRFVTRLGPRFSRNATLIPLGHLLLDPTAGRVLSLPPCSRGRGHRRRSSPPGCARRACHRRRSSPPGRAHHPSPPSSRQACQEAPPSPLSSSPPATGPLLHRASRRR